MRCRWTTSSRSRIRTAARELAQRPRRAAVVPGDKAAAAAAHGADYAPWVLDQLGIDIMFANRVAMGPGLPPARFVWVPFADALMYPLDNERMIHHPDHRAFFPLEEKLLKRYYAESGVAVRPKTLAEYLDTVVRPTLERHKAGGAVAEKYEMAYLRPLDIGNPSRAEAERAYATADDGDDSGYRALQDYIFRFIAAECGRLGMAVHLHVAHGGGSYFNVAGANPLLLEPILDDPLLRRTTFVMVHGGWPFTNEITALLTKPNAYVDFYAQTGFTSTHSLAEVLARAGACRKKVMFATDAYPASKDVGWKKRVHRRERRPQALGWLTAMLRDARASAPWNWRAWCCATTRALYQIAACTMEHQALATRRKRIFLSLCPRCPCVESICG
jgi:hypothetical protein